MCKSRDPFFYFFYTRVIVRARWERRFCKIKLRIVFKYWLKLSRSENSVLKACNEDIIPRNNIKEEMSKLGLYYQCKKMFI